MRLSIVDSMEDSFLSRTALNRLLSMTLQVGWMLKCGSLRIKNLGGTRANFVFSWISRRRTFLTHCIFSSLISWHSLLLALGLKRALILLSENKRVFLSHRWRPPCIFIYSQNTFQEIYKSFHGIHFTLSDEWCKITLQLSSFFLSF